MRSRNVPPPSILAGNDREPLDDLTITKEGRVSQVRVVSFDLDNTLWRTSPTIAAANDALADFLRDRCNLVPPKRVEKVMGELFQANRLKYCPIDSDTNNAKSPVLLTQLRKDAIEHVLLSSNNSNDDNNNFSPEHTSTLVEHAFEAWAMARHTAIVSHLAPSVVESLEEIASWRTQEGHRILIGAITDGNSDPTAIDGLGSYFDFCVNAELVGVSKPDSRVYLEAVAHVLESHSHLHEALGLDGASEMSVEELLGPWWVHVGDDFIKDVVAAKGLSMRTVWCRELVLDQGSRAPLSERKPERTVEELVKQVSEMEVIRMHVGSEDYLADSVHREFADAIVDKFADVSKRLLEWHSEAMQNPTKVDNDAQRTETSTYGPHPEQASPSSALPERSIKFCIHCGAQLPRTAKFCSACGEKQT